MGLLRRLTLRFGRSPGAPALVHDLAPLTVFVGPNNSGKSLVLRELNAVTSGRTDPRFVVDTVDLSPMNEAAFRGLLQPRLSSTRHDGGREFVEIRSLDVGGGQQRGPHTINVTHEVAELVAGRTSSFLQNAVAQFTLQLDGRTRLDLVGQRQLGEMEHAPGSTLANLFRADVLRARLRDLLHSVFNRYLVVDPTNPGHVRLRYSSVPPTASLERGLTDDSLQFQRQATLISTMSDGVQSFTGIVLALLGAGARCFQIDEPEAFLHPPLARRLGRIIATEVATSDSNGFASTHSADFLMGAIESGQGVDVIRLTFTDAVPTARLLASADLETLMRDPLLRSTDVLDALFHAGAVITEADADRAFYQEINMRLSAANSGAANDTVFLNAVGKGTVHRLIRPLRLMGLPAVALVDIDIIRTPGVLRPLLQAASFDVPDVNRLMTEADAIRGFFDEHHLDMKATGLGGLAGAELARGNALVAELASYGIFVVPVGEPEGWLRGLGAVGHGSDWLIDIFARMGSDPAGAAYVQPAAGDVWDFVRRIAQWIANTNRHGIPA